MLKKHKKDIYFIYSNVWKLPDWKIKNYINKKKGDCR